jgi:C_GCAxxG_C_C family probable redox protein
MREQMMDDNTVERAAGLFKEGLSCSQAVVGVFGERFGLEQETALKISAAFGGGMKMAGTCGAVTGGLMVLGLKYGQTEGEDKEGKKKITQIARDFEAKFNERHGSLVCRELLGCDISTPKGIALAKEKGLLSTICPTFVCDAVEILEEMLASAD